MDTSMSATQRDAAKKDFPDPQSVKYHSESEISDFIEKLNNKISYLKDETQLFRRYADRITQGKGFKTRERDPNSMMRESSNDMDQQVIFLTAEQKADIASHDADELRRELSRIDDDIKLYSDRFACKIRECEQFKKFVDDQAKDFRFKVANPSVGAERLFKWLEESVKNLESMLRSQSLTNASDMAHIRALQQALSKQIELGENLTQVDFMKVEIENRLLVEAFDKSKSEIQNTNRENNGTSMAIADFTGQSIDLTRSIQEGQTKLATETEMIRKLNAERERIDDILSKLESWISKAKEQNMRCPSIAVYIHVEKDIELLEQLCKESERKLQIVEMASRLKSVTASATNLPRLSTAQHLRKKIDLSQPQRLSGLHQEPYEISAIPNINLSGLMPSSTKATFEPRPLLNFSQPCVTLVHIYKLYTVHVQQK